MATSTAQFHIPKRSGNIVVDGKLNDSAWNNAAMIRGFYQREPDEGAPMSEDTEVFICYDAGTITGLDGITQGIGLDISP